ncbi:glycine receptor subunit alphaZ1-like [Ptychodera flava]|uniref:glycine receptor subunit alphaZ1-like n=1 Tax=Ptychodera flava TaxID=63121 RepID=UPI00396A70D0
MRPGFNTVWQVSFCVLATAFFFVSGSSVRVPRHVASSTVTGNEDDATKDVQPHPGNIDGNGQQDHQEKSFTQMLNKLNTDYDSRIRPNASGAPVIVRTNLYIISGFSTVAETMDFNLMAFIRQRWNDPRLKFNGTSNNSLSVNPKLIDQLWVPDMFFANENDGKLHQLTVKNEALRIYPDGDVLFSMRVSLTLACNMDLRLYPMDVQLCHLTMESYGFRTHDLLFHWTVENAVDINEELEIAEFRYPSVKTIQFNKTYTTGSYSSLRAYFLLQRVYDFHLIQTYIPTIVIVVISWLSFWLNPESVPARVSLGITTLLTITSQAAGVRAGLPKVSYVKAIDVWMTTCLVFVFASLAEYAVVNYISTEKNRRKQKREAAAKKMLAGDSSKDNTMELDALNGDRRQHSKFERNPQEDIDERDYRIATLIADNVNPRKVDKVSRVVFPVLFLLFNILYWPLCLVSYNDDNFNDKS